jgi:hypothetical protein
MKSTIVKAFFGLLICLLVMLQLAGIFGRADFSHVRDSKPRSMKQAA